MPSPMISFVFELSFRCLQRCSWKKPSAFDLLLSRDFALEHYMLDAACTLYARCSVYIMTLLYAMKSVAWIFSTLWSYFLLKTVHGNSLYWQNINIKQFVAEIDLQYIVYCINTKQSFVNWVRIWKKTNCKMGEMIFIYKLICLINFLRLVTWMWTHKYN